MTTEDGGGMVAAVVEVEVASGTVVAIGASESFTEPVISFITG